MRLKDLIEVIDMDSFVETITEIDMLDGKPPTLQGTWGEYTKRLTGKKVVINDKYYVSEKNKGKIFEVTSEPYSVCGTVVVKLKGLSGCYALDGLDEVNDGKTD